MINPFVPAVKEQLRLRLALSGASGGGKTFSALKIGALLLGGSEHGDTGAKLARRENGLARIALIDTERGSARKYGGEFPSDTPKQALFDVLEMGRNDQGAIDVVEMTNAIEAAAKYGYELIIVDSFSHAWEGILDEKDRVDRRNNAKGANSFTNWREVNPLHAKLLDSLLSYPGHVIVTMRTKTEYSIEKEDGRTVVRKIGVQAVQRAGVEYEFDIVMDMSLTIGGQNAGTFEKSRCHALKKMVSITNPGKQFVEIVRDWLESGVEPIAPMKREEFILAMKERGISEGDIGKTLDSLGLNGFSGTHRYNNILEAYDANLAKAS